MNHPQATTLATLAKLVDGHVVGDPETLVFGAFPIDEACAGSITLADNSQRVKELQHTKAAAAVVLPGSSAGDLPCIEVDDVHAAFTAIVTYYRPRRAAVGVSRSPAAVISTSARIDPTAQIHPGAIIGNDVEIAAGVVVYPGVVVGDGCRIGEDTQLFPNVTLYADVVIGKRCLIHSGAVIGAYGFGYAQKAGRHVLSAQLGGVEIGDDVDVGAVATIDCGVYAPTRVGDGTKIDNLVQIAHNCQIGKHNLICSQVGIAGSTTTGDYVVMGGQVGVRDHVSIGDHAVVGAKSGVSHDVPPGVKVLGVPAAPERDQKMSWAAVAKLPAMRRDFKQLRRLVEQLRQAIHLDSSQHEATDRAA